MVLIGVLLMLAIGSMWASHAWQQTFAQQRMMQHQALEVLAWQAAEAGGMYAWQQHLHQACPKTGESLQEGAPATRWRVSELLDQNQLCSLLVIGEVLDTSTGNALVIAQAHLLVEITEEGEPPRSTIKRWQRVYPR